MHTPPCHFVHTHTREFCAHTSTPMCTGTQRHFHAHTGMVLRSCFFISAPTGPLPRGTHVHHTWQHTHSSSPHFSLPGSGPRGSGPGWRAGVSAWTVPLPRPRRTAASQVPRPGPRLVDGEGAVITRPRGLSFSTCLSSRPRPAGAQTLITASRPVISRGRGRTRRPAGPTQRGCLGLRCESAAATPPSPWQVGEVPCPEEAGWSSPGLWRGVL